MQANPLLNDWQAPLFDSLHSYFDNHGHGDWPRWVAALQALPDLAAETVDLNNPAITVTHQTDDDPSRLKQQLLQFQPWRKGPYSIHGVYIDAEWRCDQKWDRLKNEIQPLSGRDVLDVGCGNGYYCWRMHGAGANFVMGIDPGVLCIAQYLVLYHFLGPAPVFVLPMKSEQLPNNLHAFDTVFSMGVFYHRRAPMDHLLELYSCLRPGGELVLETLVIEGEEGQVLVPQTRYAQMRNVWFLPSCGSLALWLKRCGFRKIRLINVTVTVCKEQRSTEWMKFHSLENFLDTHNPQCTVEGYPAPRRAIFIAEK